MFLWEKKRRQHHGHAMGKEMKKKNIFELGTNAMCNACWRAKLCREFSYHVIRWVRCHVEKFAQFVYKCSNTVFTIGSQYHLPSGSSILGHSYWFIIIALDIYCFVCKYTESIYIEFVSSIYSYDDDSVSFRFECLKVFFIPELSAMLCCIV